MLRQDVLEHLGNGFDLQKLLMEEALFPRRDFVDEYVQAVSLSFSAAMVSTTGLPPQE
jgi:hypothetical protein